MNHLLSTLTLGLLLLNPSLPASADEVAGIDPGVAVDKAIGVWVGHCDKNDSSGKPKSESPQGTQTSGKDANAILVVHYMPGGKYRNVEIPSDYAGPVSMKRPGEEGAPFIVSNIIEPSETLTGKEAGPAIEKQLMELKKDLQSKRRVPFARKYASAMTACEREKLGLSDSAPSQGDDASALVVNDKVKGGKLSRTQVVNVHARKGSGGNIGLIESREVNQFMSSKDSLEEFHTSSTDSTCHWDKQVMTKEDLPDYAASKEGAIAFGGKAQNSEECETNTANEKLSSGTSAGKGAQDDDKVIGVTRRVQ